MKASARHNPENGLPENLGEWYSTDQLGRWIEELLDSFDWDNPELARQLHENPEFHPRALLRLLTLAAAEGRSDAHTVAERCLEDRVYRAAGEGGRWRVVELMVFREKNRVLLELVLSELMKRVVKEKFECTILPRTVKHYIASLAALRLDTAIMSDRQLVAA